MLATTQIMTLQNAATTNANGVAADVSNYTASQNIEIRETAGGTATVTFEGSFDGTNWYAIGYQPILSATLTRSVTGVSVTANLIAVYQIIERFPQIRARISAISAANITAKLFAVAD